MTEPTTREGRDFVAGTVRELYLRRGIVLDADEVHGLNERVRAIEAEARRPALDVDALAEALAVITGPDWVGRIAVTIPLDAYEETDDPATVRVARSILDALDAAQDETRSPRYRYLSPADALADFNAQGKEDGS